MQFSACAVAALLLFSRSPARSATPDEAARFLAGLPMHGSSLEGLAARAIWVDHAMASDDAWRPLESRQLGRIREWADVFLQPEHDSRAPVFYFFSGPDFLYAQTLFPNAADYVLCGLEPVGAMPDLEQLPPAVLGAALANLRKAMNSALSFSFFITKEMKVDLTQTQLSGTLPVLLVFLARGGCRVDSIQPVDLDISGVATSGKAATSGAEIIFFGPHGRKQRLHYFTADLSNGAVKANPAILKWSASLGQGQSLLKAASYLLHNDGFSTARDFLLKHSDTLVQDDSGIPLRFFRAREWQLRFFGRYAGPIDLFKERYQPELRDAYARSLPPPLAFSFGYRWHPRESGMLVARRPPKQPED